MYKRQVHQVIGRDEVRGAVARIGHLGGLDDLPRVGVRYAQPLQHFNVHIRKAELFQLLDSPIGNGAAVAFVIPVPVVSAAIPVVARLSVAVVGVAVPAVVAVSYTHL